MNRREFVLSAAVCGAVTALAGKADAAPDIGQLDDLIEQMTVEEKAGQLNLQAALSPHMADPDIAKQNPFLPPITEEQAKAQFASLISDVKGGHIGALMTPMDLDSVFLAQQAAVRDSRLKIPLFFAADIIHGVNTVFPVPLAEAASFEPDLARRTARACAVEATANGLDMTFAPMVDIGRDQRWGRVVEGAGEDVLLGCRFAAARVRGFQGDRPAAADSLLACVKHFAAYGAAESGLDYQGAAISERVLHEVYLPPFKAAFDAGAIMTMASFNTIDGVPATGNHHLLTDILRGELGFDGAVVSDFESEKELVAHGFAADDEEATRLALLAGCDISMISGLYRRYIPALVRSGAISKEVLDRAVRRVLFVKKQAGLFDDPFRRIDRKRNRASTPPAHRTLAREAARKAVVLLKNRNKLLPLQTRGQRIALIGPFASDTANLNGPWSPFAPSAPPVSLEAGIRQVLDSASLTVTAGSDIDKPLTGGIASAVAAANASDVVVLAIGESQAMSGESSSRTEIVVPEAQQALAEAVASTGKPLVVILRNGRALALKGAVRDADAILVGWFLGSETGNALADILFGKYSPGGRLPVTFPLETGQEPYYYARESSGRPAPSGSTKHFTSHFLGIPDEPLYPFGHGLTYGDIVYGPPRCSGTMKKDGTLDASATVTNKGQQTVEEVVQLYIHDRAAMVVQPVRKLIDFQKVTLAPGQSVDVQFTIDPKALSHLDQQAKPVAGKGVFDLWIGPDARAGKPVAFTIN